MVKDKKLKQKNNILYKNKNIKSTMTMSRSAQMKVAQEQLTTAVEYGSNSFTIQADDKDILDRITSIIQKQLPNVDVSQLDAIFPNVDSIDILELVIEIEEEFKIIITEDDTGAIEMEPNIRKILQVVKKMIVLA